MPKKNPAFFAGLIFVKSYIYDRNTLLLLYILFITNISEKYDTQKSLIILLTKCVNSDIITIFIVKLYE